MLGIEGRMKVTRIRNFGPDPRKLTGGDSFCFVPNSLLSLSSRALLILLPVTTILPSSLGIYILLILGNLRPWSSPPLPSEWVAR